MQEKQSWEKHYESWQKSDLSITEYCKKEGLNRTRFYDFKSKLKKKVKNAQTFQAKHAGFIPVSVKARLLPVCIKLNIEYPGSKTLTLESNDMSLILKLLATMDSRNEIV